MSELASSRNSVWRYVIAALCMFFCYTSGKAQVITANFTYDSIPCGTANINFAASVFGPVSPSDCEFEWDFGDGKPIKTGQTVNNDFPVKPGEIHIPFLVKLTVWRISPLPKVVLYTITKNITVSPAPIPILTDIKNLLTPFDNCAKNPTIQSPFFTIQVNNASSDINTIANYRIDWGDSIASNHLYVKADFPITHIYSRLGLFKLKFTAIGQNGCEASKVYTVKNQGNPAIGISSGGNTTGCAPVKFAFRLDRVYKNDSETTYIWDFGDGSPTMNWTIDSIKNNDSTVFHTFTKSSCGQPNGEYIVKITATNACKSTTAYVGAVNVGIKPEPEYTISNLCEGGPVNFQNTTMPGSNFDCTKGVVYMWDFGDGSPKVITTSSANIPHTFPTSGNVYFVKLSAVNQCQDSSFVTHMITLTRLPNANATLTPLKGCNPLTVNATNASTGDIQLTTWRVSPATGWSFGNGTTAKSLNPQFIFTTKGNYVVTLQVKNECTFNEKNFNVFVNGPIDVTFPAIANQCNTYIFDATKTAAFKLNLIANETVQAKWQVTPVTGFTFVNSTTEQSLYPQIRFDNEGDYSISVIMKNGCDSITIKKSFKFALTPIAKAVASVTEGCIPQLKVHFDNQSTGYQEVPTWTVTPTAGASFINNTTALSENPDIQFDLAGNYTVKLSVTNSCGTNTTSFFIKAKDKPSVNLLPLPDICENGTIAISLANLNVLTNNGGTPIYEWAVTPNTGFSYQAGTFSHSANPTYLFAVPGIYEIKVTVTNDCGSVTKTQMLNVRAVVNLVTSISDTSGCAPKTTSFTDNSTGYQITHKWTILPATGFLYAVGNSTSPAPSILFTQSGIYTIKHTVTGMCNSQSKTFTVGISTLPSVNLSPISDRCTLPFQLIIDSTNFNINQNGKTLSNIHWETMPETVVTYIDGTDENSKYPHFEFNKPGLYTVWVETQNYCGLTTASQTFRIFDNIAEHAVSSVNNGCAPLQVSFMDQSAGDLRTHNWTVLPATGWVMTPSPTSASPDIRFNKTGIYSVTHTISNLCGTDSHTYTIKVIEPPTVLLSPLPNACNTFTFIADQQNMKVTKNLNDTISYLWTVTPNRAITYLSNTGDTSHYPVIQIADTGVFKVTVRALGKCGYTESSQTIGITKGPEVFLTPQFPSNCLPADLTFNGSVYGQNIIYNWTITPLEGASFLNSTTSSSLLPEIRFSRPGNYTVSVNATNNCSNDIKKWDFTIISKPTILFNTITDTCDNFAFKAERYVVVQDNGNAISNYNWTVFPTTGFNYLNGTSASSNFPHILFTTAGTYKLTMNTTNECGKTSFSQSFTIDQFVQVKAGNDTTLCTNNNLYLLSGSPAGGTWSILPVAASNVLRLIGGTYYLDLNVPGNYSLTYKKGNSYCSSEVTRQFNILALPLVDAGRDITICENYTKLYPLNGTPAGGTWSGEGVTGNTFSTLGLATGSYILKYIWIDSVTNCSNTDQLVAKVTYAPVTEFNASKQGCKDTPILFTPSGPPNTNYNWNFGDGQTAISSGSINHTYRAGGTYTVSMISADPNNCSDMSSSKIIIFDDIIFPIVTVNPTTGCGPLHVTYTVDTTGTKGNGQSFSWNFGNGQMLNEAFTRKEVIYNQGIADTIYNATLTISNSCFSHTVIYPISVNSFPNANFVIPHDWECSPTTVQFRNLTLDRTASYFWDFGDGTTSIAYQPTHTFTTGKVATEYIIKLIARNGCGKDSISRPLLIKPNSIEAFIQISPRLACPGDTITFTNYSTDTLTKIMNYYWDFGDGTVSNTWNATHAYATGGKYTVKLFVDNGCSFAEKIDQIEILPSFDLSINSRDSICLGEALNLEAFSNSGPLLNARWDFGDNSFGNGVKTNHSFSTSGWKNITLTAASVSGILHCAATAVKRVYIKASPILLQSKDIEGCSPVSLSLKTAGQEALLWNFGEDSVWSSSGIYTYKNAGDKPIRRKVSVLSENSLGCQASSSFWVTVFPNPIAKIGIRSEEGSPEKVFLNSLSTNTNSCEWLFPDGTSSEGCDLVLIRLYNNGFYKIQLRSSNQYGCSDTTSVIHQTIIKGLFVPNAFQPLNFSKEVNIFKPIGIGLKTYYLGIYDVWGNPIWETDKLDDTKPAEGWDGKTNKGISLQMDVYIWRIKAVFIDGTTWKGMKGKDGVLRTEGTVTLIK